MSLATLADLKAMRGIPPTNTRRDGMYQIIVDAANEWVARHTNYSNAPAGTFTDYFENVQLGTAVTLNHRPVDAISAVEAWLPSGVWDQVGAWTEIGWAAITGHLVDPQLGTVQFMTDIWTEQSDLAGLFAPAPFFRWRASYLPAARITYTTLSQAVPAVVRSAAVALAAYWATRIPAGATSQLMLGRHMQQQFMDKDVPAWVETMIAPYRQESQAMWA